MLSQAGKNWHRADVKAALSKRGATLALLARQSGLSRQSFSWALLKPHPRANTAIATFLGKPLHELWPQWFDAAGNRLDLIPNSGRRARRTRGK